MEQYLKIHLRLFSLVYDWRWDAPSLAKSAIGIVAAITYIVQGVLSIGAGKFITSATHRDLGDHFYMLKVLNCLAILMSSSLLGVSGYLVSVFGDDFRLESTRFLNRTARTFVRYPP